MSKITTNPGRVLPHDVILTTQEIKELGLTPAPADIGKSWEDHIHQSTKGTKHGQ